MSNPVTSDRDHSPSDAPPAPADELITRSEDDTASFLHAPEPENLIPTSSDLGREFDGYKLVRVLGAGGMGTVWEAEDLRLLRLVAIKRMMATLLACEKARERFLREARSQAAIHHEHVAPIHAVGEHEGTPYIVMPLLLGETLAIRLARPPIFTPAEILRIGREIAAGLAAAHGKQLVHRDIKPSNIWLEGDDAKVQLLDFGLARSAEHDSEVVITASGVVLGTPAYMAPEQAAGAPVDGRADLFAFGMVLYEMCTGKRPYTGTSLYSTLLALATREPPAAHEVRAEIPLDLSVFIQGLLIKDPAKRQPQSAQLCVKQIDQMQAGESPVKRNPPLVTRRQRRWWILAACLVVGLVGIGVGIALWTRGTVPPTSKSASEQLQSYLTSLRGKEITSDRRDTSKNGILGNERMNLYQYNGRTGIPLLNEIEPGKFTLKIPYAGQYERRGYTLGILSTREDNACSGRLEYTIRADGTQYRIVDQQQISDDTQSNPVNHDSHRSAKDAVEILLRQVMPDLR